MNDPNQTIFADLVLPAPPTSIGKRIGAAVIDGILLVAIFLVLNKFFGDHVRTINYDGTTTSNEYRLQGWPALAYMLFWFLLMPLMEGTTGQTVGKRLSGIKAVRENGDPPGIGLSLVRHLFDCIDCIFIVGIIVAATNPKRKRIGDLVAGTYVVDKTN